MKGLKSSDDLEAEVDEDDGIIRLNELIDLRSVALNSPISAVRCFYRGNVPYAFVWSNRELLVSA
ncbi:hypothetical protein PHLCEN_2v6970 [Hermanssonia centrifuga]|uniref:Uncharacterized protein n=1 Tax=Hermanssonia centrifuga TaxID=98765 RepID=A0A2R6NXY2_9APHY|nr:hypothetical protein PHLCEN_2v6970 [Hermanssonia centrifuga]